MFGYRKFVGFYWTLPVPSAGFTSLPKSLDEAAQKSMTIRYQRELIARFVKNERGTLVGELFFLELAADRGTEHVEDVLTKAVDLCQKHKAQLLFVDFAQEGGWRNHPFMSRLMQRAPVSCLGLDPEPIFNDGQMFDPIAHFKRARKAAADRRSASERRDALIARLREMLPGDLNTTAQVKALVARLNLAGVKTVNGRIWTEPNLRAFLRKHSTLSPSITIETT